MKLKYIAYWASGWILPALNPVIQRILRWKDPERHRFYNIAREIHKAYKGENLNKAEALALEYLELAKRFAHDWNYGNAIHTSHQALGLIHLRRGDTEKAKEHLIAAGKTPGSPQLNSYGPNMLLARKLVLRGEKKVVIEYLDLVAKFWATNKSTEFQYLARENKTLIKQWRSEVRKGRVPDHENWN